MARSKSKQKIKKLRFKQKNKRRVDRRKAAKAS